jgi:hypothetical protein
VIIEPGFAERDHFGMPRAGDEFGGRDVQFLVGVMWVRTDGSIDVGEALGDGEEFGLARNARRDRDDAGDAGIAGASDDRVKLGGEVGKIEVTMAVN